MAARSNRSRPQYVNVGMIGRSWAGRALAAGIVATLALATGCHRGESTNPLVERYYQGWPAGAGLSEPAGAGPVAVLQPNHRMELALTGSSSCPSLPVALTVVDRHAIEVRAARLTPTSTSTRSEALAVCANDTVPTTSVLRLPPAVDTTRPVLVTVHFAPGGAAEIVTAYPASGLAPIGVAPTGLVPMPDSTLVSGGVLPADAVSSRAAIRAAFDRALTGTDPAGTTSAPAGGGFAPTDRSGWALAAVEDGPAMRRPLAELVRRFPAAARSSQVVVGAIDFVDVNHATVRYTLSFTGAGSGTPRTGTAVRAGAGTAADPDWKVGRDTYCAVLSLAGVACPPA
ncbi:hypothetical protein I6A60_10050 [Frankia sp. AgB1.9]|uniref:hypothetical protein n=1 Tax=unclassified Frankia TaxID=2632575 RepID=UPI001931338F|nr:MULTISPECIES: hypothetical protein [unclassified Frankia]MBL7548217.1 hypothetical protein [Frankia sp. AgB1.9]MBL7621510.1 hypothetical protein [Frankia sp. AgB1.8]